MKKQGTFFCLLCFLFCNLLWSQITITTGGAALALALIKNSFITLYPKPIAKYSVNPEEGSVIQPLEIFTNESVDYTKWWWSFGDGPEIDSVNKSPSHFYTSDNADTYHSILIVKNQYGCLDTAEKDVIIKPDFVFYIPNAFTPNNEDGLNDRFGGKGVGIDKYEMWIFDRWGMQIYYTDDIKKGWDGKVQGKSSEPKQDVYVWKVRLIDVLGKTHNYIGHVTILK